MIKKVPIIRYFKWFSLSDHMCDAKSKCSPVSTQSKFVSASLVSNLKFKKNPHTCTYNLLDEQPNLIYFFKPRNSLHIYHRFLFKYFTKFIRITPRFIWHLKFIISFLQHPVIFLHLITSIRVFSCRLQQITAGILQCIKFA